MTSTQRLLAVLTGKMPDRVPISTYELVGHNPDSFENTEPSYRPLMDFIREHTDCIYMTGIDVPNMADSRCMKVQKWDEAGSHWKKVTYDAGGRTLTKVTSRTDDVHTTWTRKHWCGDLEDAGVLLDRPVEFGKADFGALTAAWVRLGDDKGLPLISLADPLCELAELFEFGEFTVLAMTETDTIVKYLDQIHERRLAELGLMLAGPVKNTVWRIVGPEYAAPPYMPPELFRRFVTPYVSQYVRMIHSAGAFARLHVHGKIGRLLDQFIEMGVDATDPVEPPPDGDATVSKVKAAIGDRVCLMGGIELKFLENNDEKSVEKLTRQIMAEGKPGGRFVIMPTAAPINVPLSPQTDRNYRRFIQTALETGQY